MTLDGRIQSYLELLIFPSLSATAVAEREGCNRITQNIKFQSITEKKKHFKF